MYKTASDLLIDTSSFLEIPPIRNCCEWAKEKRIMAGNEKFDSSKTPYIEPIARATINPNFEEIVGWLMSQGGKTELTLNIGGHLISEIPNPITFAFPNKKLAESMSKDRFDNMAKNSFPHLLDTHKNGTIYEKFYNGTVVRFIWTSSANEVCMHPVCYVVVDELDRHKNIKGEGDPLELLKSRMVTFIDSKIIMISSPLIEGVSKIQKNWKKGTRYIYCFVCSSCRLPFEPKFDLLEFGNKTNNFDDSFILCPNCEKQIKNKERLILLQKSSLYLCEEDLENKPRITDIPNDRIFRHVEGNKIGSFRVNGLFSPFQTLGKMVRRYNTAMEDDQNRQHSVQSVINTVFGQTWKIKTKEIKTEDVKEKCCANYKRGEVPEKLSLVVGADIQKRGIFWVCRGFAKDKKGTSYLIDYGFVSGDTLHDETWKEFYQTVIKSTYGEKRQFIRKSGIDSGYRCDEVYIFCENKNHKSIPTKGVGKSGSAYKFSNQELKIRGKQRKINCNIMLVSDRIIKETIFSRIEKDIDECGSFLLPSDIDDYYIRQLTAEAPFDDDDGVNFVKIRDENHLLDCEVICFAIGYYYLRLHKQKTSNNERKIEEV